MIYYNAWRRRLAAAVTACATLMVTLGLLVGIPWVLWWATGIPWPEHVSSLSELGERLMQPVTDPLMLDLLAITGWVCWAAFAVTVIREGFWYAAHLPQLVRSRRVHEEHLAGLSLKRSLAAVCVGTLVLALISLLRPDLAQARQHVPASGEMRPQVAATAPADPSSPSWAGSTSAAAQSPAQAATNGQSHPSETLLPPQSPGSTEVRHVEYTVVEGDTLWDIAHEHLGDSLKWPRIYKLNKDRVQHDGQRLTDPDLVRPGWRLSLPVPDSATSPAPSTPEPPRPAPPSNESATPTPAPAPGNDSGEGAREDRHPPAPPNEQDRPAKHEQRTSRETAAIGLGEAGLIGVTAAAGLLAARRYWRHHRRRLRHPGEEAESAPLLSPHVDRATQAAHAARQPRLDDDPDALITRRTRPKPPRAERTVTVGERDNTEVALDELAVPGGCTWTGPGAEDAARALLTAILTAAERQRPDRVPHVTAATTEELAERLLPGLPQQFTALTQHPDTAHIVRAAEQHLVLHARERSEQDSLLRTAPRTAESEQPGTSGHGAEAVSNAGPGVLVILVEPQAAHLGQLEALAARSHPDRLIVISLTTELPGSTHWTIAADGTAHATRPGGPAHTPLRFFHVTPQAGREMTDFLLAAHGERPRLRALPAPAPAHPEPAEEEDETEPAQEPGAPLVATAPPLPKQSKAVRLHVLGPIRLYARGNSEPVGTNMRPEAHEFLALLAAHPAGLLAADIAEKLRLDEENISGSLKNLRRAVRRTLREATRITGTEFILLQGELHKLNPELVETDLADFSDALDNTRSSADTDGIPTEALAALRQALAHYQGPFAQGADYIWADTLREHLTLKATDAASRLAHRAEHTATPAQRDATLALLEHLGTHHPDHERLAQHTIRLHQAAGRLDAARHTYQRLQRHLSELGLEPDPATRALVEPRAQARNGR